MSLESSLRFTNASWTHLLQVPRRHPRLHLRRVPDTSRTRPGHVQDTSRTRPGASRWHPRAKNSFFDGFEVVSLLARTVSKASCLRSRRVSPSILGHVSTMDNPLRGVNLLDLV